MMWVLLALRASGLDRRRRRPLATSNQILSLVYFRSYVTHVEAHACPIRSLLSGCLAAVSIDRLSPRPRAARATAHRWHDTHARTHGSLCRTCRLLESTRSPHSLSVAARVYILAESSSSTTTSAAPALYLHRSITYAIYIIWAQNIWRGQVYRCM